MTEVDMEKLLKQQEERFQKYVKAPSYDELEPLGRSWNFYEDFQMYDENGEELEPSVTLTELEIAKEYARSWADQIENFMLEMPNENDWEMSVGYAAEEGLGVTFSEDGGGWHNCVSDIDHPSVLRARHLGEMQAIEWLCKRHGFIIPAELHDQMEARRARIHRDLSAIKPSSQPVNTDA